MPREEQPSSRTIALPALAALGCLFFWAAQLTFDAGDWPGPHQFPHNQPTQNACGRAGAFVAFYLADFLGDGVYPLLLFASCAAFLWLMRGHIVNLGQRMFGLALLVGCTAAASSLVTSESPHGLVYGSGGLVGVGLGRFLQETFSGTGTVLVLGYGFLVGLLFTAEGWMLRLPDALKRVASYSAEAARIARDRIPKPAFAASGEASSAGMGSAAVEIDEPIEKGGSSGKASGGNRRELRINTGVPDSKVIGKGKQTTLFEDEHEDDESVSAGRSVKGRADAGGSGKSKREAELGSAAGASKRRKQTNPPEVVPVKAAQGPPPVGGASQQLPLEYEPPPPPAAAYPKPLREWRYPPLSILGDPEYTFDAQRETDLRIKARILEKSLEEFRLEARVVEIDTGPVITLFELEIGAGIKVSQFSALANDIARALKAPSIRIIAPIPGKNTVGVEVPNERKEKVRIKALLASAGSKLTEMAIPLFLGKDASGNSLIADIASMPHMLIAGTTGSGKSVCMNSIIMSILLCRRPDHVKLILIDPKMVELSQFKEVPHLMAPIVTDMARAEKILDWAVTKMDERYALIAEARVRNIGSYNALGAEEIFNRLQPATEDEKAAIPTRLPYIVIMIDELADLMMTSGKEVEHHLARLAQKSRAVGIHIVVATQRPEAKVVTGLIKSNLPCRVAFRVASRMDSRIVLDQNGAELLMGQGDMLFLPPGSHKLRRAQGTYIEDDELAKVLEFLGEQGRAEFHPELVKIPGAGADVGELDPLYDNAVEVVLDTKRGSVSLLQRRLTIGYSRASRLIEQMAATGIVGEYKGSQAREVLITLDEWKTMKQSRAMNDSLDAVAAPFEVDVDGPSSGSGDVFDASDADSDDGGAASSRSKPAAVGSKDMERRHAQSSVDDDDGWEEYDDDTDDDDDDDLDDDELDDEDDDFDDDDDLGDDDDVEDRAPDASRDPR